MQPETTPHRTSVSDVISRQTSLDNENEQKALVSQVSAASMQLSNSYCPIPIIRPVLQVNLWCTCSMYTVFLPSTCVHGVIISSLFSSMQV